MNPCRKCGRKPTLYSYTVFGFAESGRGFYEVSCSCGEGSGRFEEEGKAVADWDRRNHAAATREGDPPSR